MVSKTKLRYVYFKRFVNRFWFIPSDVLQRSIEANIWHICKISPPVLEVGIGNGEISNMLFSHYPNKIDIGIDIEAESIKQAKDCTKYKKVLCVDAANMPFKNISFNTVLSNSTFEHIQEDKKAVREIGRVLKKGGIFLTTVPSAFLPEWILEYETAKNKRTAKKKLTRYNKRAAHYHYRSVSEWKQIFSTAGLELIIHKYYFPKEVSLYYYRIFTIFTSKIRGKEIWSYIGHSKLSILLPKRIICALLEHYVLKNAFERGFFTNQDEGGGMLFLVAQKR